MSAEDIPCVLLADRHHGLSEGIRSLLEQEFAAVVMVADEASLLESAARLQPDLLVADLSLARGEGFGWLRRLLARCPDARVLVLSTHDERSVIQGALAAGAAGVVLKREIATHLLPAVHEIMDGRHPAPPVTPASPPGTVLS